MTNKETACLFFWDCRLDVQKHSYKEVEDMFDQWVNSSERSSTASQSPQQGTGDGWIEIGEDLWRPLPAPPQSKNKEI